ncbi:MAG: SDR family oxidoreductase [Ignavibacteria bacterium]
MKRILILGANGMLGHAAGLYFQQKDYEVTALVRGDFDAATTDVSLLSEHILQSELVINCIGVIKQIIDNYTPYETVKINGIFPRNLAKLCKASNVPMIHITTDCAYSGSKGNYNENDFYDAGDLYGISKVAGESSDCMNLRTSIIGPEKNTSRSLLGWVFSQKGKTVNGFTNHMWNGVTTLQLAGIIEEIIENNLYQPGLFHIHSPDARSKYELVKMISDIFGLNITVTPKEGSEFCDRTLSSIYPLNEKLSKRKIEDQLVELKNFFKL